MKPKANVILIICLVWLLPVVALGQKDAFGKPDSLFADLSKVDDNNWKIDISFVNDEWVEALSIPLKLKGGDIRLKGDSAIFTGGRIEKFDYKGFRADTAIQCVTLGLVANLGPNQKSLPPGSGRIVTVFVSSPDKGPIKDMNIDTTFTRPNNKLLVIAKRIQPGEPPDTIGYDREDEKQIIPVWVVTKPE
ncbi:MAG: hypothetical protein OEV49_15795 [candidate division Zixibacteria bacterium]|nr:hypothetical protein [candidate division Zixibacteria bacterium]MDH3938310.1 hypothetical protein [candidate division Zixibacteria bacterium]MDH4033952.1 hypothetical protein [candidate division Zixibacteria bacterium]